MSAASCCLRSTGLSLRPVAGSEIAAAKLSMPICIIRAPETRLPYWMTRLRFCCRLITDLGMDEWRCPIQRCYWPTTTFLLETESVRAVQIGLPLATSPVAKTLSANDNTRADLDSDPK